MVFIGLLMASCCVAAIHSMPLENEYFQVENVDFEPFETYLDDINVRERRSPQQPRTNIEIQASRGPGPLSSVGVTANRNLWSSRDRSARLDANANFNRQFGAGRPTNNYGAGLRFTKRF